LPSVREFGEVEEVDGTVAVEVGRRIGERRTVDRKL